MIRRPPRSTLFPYTTPSDLAETEAESELLKCCGAHAWARQVAARRPFADEAELFAAADEVWWSLGTDDWHEDRKSTRLNSSHRCISYAVFCLKKKKQITYI